MRFRTFAHFQRFCHVRRPRQLFGHLDFTRILVRRRRFRWLLASTRVKVRQDR